MRPEQEISAPIATLTDFCWQILDWAKKILVANGSHTHVGFVFHARQLSIYQLSSVTLEEKEEKQRLWKRILKNLKAFQVVMVYECWSKDVEISAAANMPLTLEGDPEAGEALMVIGRSPEASVNLRQPFKRINGTIVFDEPEQLPYILRDAWVDGVKLSLPDYILYDQMVRLAKEIRLNDCEVDQRSD